MKQRGFILPPLALYAMLALAIIAVLSGISYSIYNAGVVAERARWEEAAKIAKEKEEKRVNEISEKYEIERVARTKQAQTVARLQRQLSDSKGSIVVVNNGCFLSVAAIGLHNSAASGKSPDTSELDATSTGIAADTLAETCQRNYATYHQVAGNLRALQDIVRQ